MKNFSKLNSIIISFTFLLVAVVNLRIVPSFEKMFSEMEIKLPVLTSMLISFNGFIVVFYLVLSALLFVTIYKKLKINGKWITLFYILIVVQLGLTILALFQPLITVVNNFD